MVGVMPAQRDFRERIHQLFQQWRKGRFDPALVEWCVTAPLVRCAVELLDAVKVTKVSNAELTQLFLAWTVELLRPPADLPPTANAQRDYTILAAYYRHGDAAKTVYQPLGGTESTFRTNWCKAATAAAADLLYDHWPATGATAIGQQWQRYVLRHHLPAAQQPLLLLLCVSSTPWPLAWLLELSAQLVTARSTTQPALTPLARALAASAATFDPLPVAEAIGWLTHVGWLSPVAPTATAPLVAFAPALRAQLYQTLTPAEVQSGHRLAAHCAWLADDPITAATHWLAAGEIQAAVQLLLAHGQALLTTDGADERVPAATPGQAGVLETMAQLIDGVPSQAVAATQWGQLKWLRGRLAQRQAHQPQVTDGAARAQLVQRALTEYQAALHFLPAGVDKAAVHYELAEHAFALDRDVADQQLRHCIELLTTVAPDHPLLVRAYIKRAWLTIQQRPDLVAAEANLKQARLLLDVLPARAIMVWSDWYNAWGTLCFCKGEFNRGVEALDQGIELLREEPNQLRLCMMLHNQGLEFSSQASGEQTIALHYLQQSLVIAVRISHVQMQMLCYKALGGCHFHLQHYGEAIRYYEQAYALIPTDSDFKVHLCYDLAEAHVMQLDPAPALTYFQQGLALAQQMGLHELIAAYHELAAGAPWLWIEPYKPRMAAALRLLLTQGQLKSQEYAQTAAINEKTALKDLQGWVAQQLLHQSGKARATTYTLNPHYRPKPSEFSHRWPQIGTDGELRQ